MKTATFLLLCALLWTPLATASDPLCVEGPLPACAYNGLDSPEPTCDAPGAQGRTTAVSVGERGTSLHAGRWESCEQDDDRSTTYERIGAWAFAGGLMVDVGYNRYTSEDAGGSSDLHVVHLGGPAAWYHEGEDAAGKRCAANVRLLLGWGAWSQAPCVSDILP